VLVAQERFGEAETTLDAARRGFEDLLGRHLLAFADHAAEFYAGSGNDCRRAFELARLNAAHRPTRRAVKHVQAIAASAGLAHEFSKATSRPISRCSRSQKSTW